MTRAGGSGGFFFVIGSARFSCIRSDPQPSRREFCALEHVHITGEQIYHAKMDYSTFLYYLQTVLCSAFDKVCLFSPFNSTGFLFRMCIYVCVCVHWVKGRGGAHYVYARVLMNICSIFILLCVCVCMCQNDGFCCCSQSPIIFAVCWSACMCYSVLSIFPLSRMGYYLHNGWPNSQPLPLCAHIEKPFEAVMSSC